MLAALALALTVGFDERLELASAVQLRSAPSTDPAGFVRSTGPYAQALLEGLDCAPPPAPKTFVFADRAQVLLRLGPKLEETRPLEYALIDRAGGRPALDSWLDGLRACRFSAPRAELERHVASFSAEGFLPAIEDYAGLAFHGSYRVLLSPLHSPGGVANVVVDEDDGTVRVLTVLGPEENAFLGRRAPGVLWHEAGHGLLDPLADLWEDEIARRSAAHRKLPWDCYGEWKQCAREHVVRAVMLRLLARRYGKAAAEEQLDFEGRERYPAMPELLRRLEREYEKDRKRWPTLADFYPRLLDVFPASAKAPPLEALGEKQSRRLGARLRQAAERGGPAVKDRAAQLLAGRPKEESAAEKLRGRAMEEFAAGKREEALASLDAALKLEPRDAGALLSRAVVLHALGRRAEAGPAYDAAVKAARGQVLIDALSSRETFLKEGEKR